KQWSNHNRFSPDGKTLAILEDGKLEIWDVASGKHLATHRVASNFEFSPDSSFLFLVEGRKLSLWDLSALSMLWSREAEKGEHHTARFTADMQNVILCNWSGLGNTNTTLADYEILDSGTGKTRRLLPIGQPLVVVALNSPAISNC